MRAELTKNQLMVAFTWGQGEDIATGRVCVTHYDYNNAQYQTDCEMVNAAHARQYWKHLIDTGFKRLASIKYTPNIPNLFAEQT